MVTGPMPRKPNATRPKANTGAAIIRPPSPILLDQIAYRHQDHHGLGRLSIGERSCRYEAGQDSERRTTFFAELYHFSYVSRFGGGETL